MAVDVLKSTAVILFNFSAMPTVSATNPPQTQSPRTLVAIFPKLRNETTFTHIDSFFDIGL